MIDNFFDTLPDTKIRKPKPPDTRPLEREVQNGIIAALERRDVYVQRVNAGQFQHEGRYIAGAVAGHSDLYGTLAPTGRAWFIEVKRRGEKPTPKQARFLAARAAEGCIAGYADTVAGALALLGLKPNCREAEQ